MKRVSITILLVFVMILSSITVVNADEGHSATFSLTTTNTNVKVGDEVSINLNLDSTTGFTGITKFVAHKVFDPTIFEYLGTTGQNGWDLKGDAVNIVLVNQENFSSGTICVLKFKVLKEVNDATIKMDELDATGDDGDVYFEDNNVNTPEVKFKVTVDDTADDPVDDPTDDPVDDPTDDPVDDPANDSTDDPAQDDKKTSGSNTEVKNDKTTATGGQIPQTGESNIGLALVIAGVVLAVVLYTKYKVYDNKMK